MGNCSSNDDANDALWGYLNAATAAGGDFCAGIPGMGCGRVLASMERVAAPGRAALAPFVDAACADSAKGKALTAARRRRLCAAAAFTQRYWLSGAAGAAAPRPLDPTDPADCDGELAAFRRPRPDAPVAYDNIEAW